MKKLKEFQIQTICPQLSADVKNGLEDTRTTQTLIRFIKYLYLENSNRKTQTMISKTDLVLGTVIRYEIDLNVKLNYFFF